MKFLFDFLVPENLDSMLFNSPKCSFFRVTGWFDFTNFREKNSQQYVVRYTKMSYTLVF